jgi:hypothetical protein
VGGGGRRGGGGGAPPPQARAVTEASAILPHPRITFVANDPGDANQRADNSGLRVDKGKWPVARYSTSWTSPSTPAGTQTTRTVRSPFALCRTPRGT